MSDPVEELRAADAAVKNARAEIEAVGEDRLQRLVDVYEQFATLIDQYEETASGSGREVFKSFVEFQGKLADFTDDLPEDLMEREAFEQAADELDRRRLDERDFERARDALTPARELVDLETEHQRAIERYRDARRAVRRRLNSVERELDELESIAAFSDVDFDAPVSELREPIEAYNDAINEAFGAFRSDASARTVIETVAAAEAFPLVPFTPPPEDLRSYLATNPVGEESISRLIEYTDYTRSKLDHYVDDPGTFQARVGGNRAYLVRLDAAPLEISWPPPSAANLRWRIRELIAVLDRFAPERVISTLHTVRGLTREEDYERLRRAARVHAELDRDERERLESGELDRELEAKRTERARLQDALSAHPDR